MWNVLLKHLIVSIVYTGFVSSKKHALDVEEAAPLDDIYNEAVDVYFQDDWQPSTKLFETVLVNYQMMQDATVACHNKCEKSDISEELGLNFSGFQELKAMGNIVAFGDCFKICMEEHSYAAIANQDLPSFETLTDLDNKRPFNFLQFAYYKTSSMKKACEAAQTYLEANPSDEEMIRNIRFYKTLSDVNETDFRNVQAPKFHIYFRRGVQAYETGNYKSAVDNFEKTVSHYFEAHRDCQLLCRKPFEQIFFYRFHKAIAVQYLEALKCSSECHIKISPMKNGAKIDNFLATCFSYMQFAYYSLNELEKAVACAASVALLLPDDSTARNNMEFYRGKAADVVTTFEPRAIVENFHLRRKEMDDLRRRGSEIFPDAVGNRDFGEVDASLEEEQSLVDVMTSHIHELMNSDRF